MQIQSKVTNCRLILLLSVFLSTGCISLAEQFARKAEVLGLERKVATGSRFQHVLYFNTGFVSKTLHVYIDGDGMPWIAGRPSNDPTPSNPLLLRMMAMDNAPAVYVGRPCYHGVETMGDCASRFWLKDRYSEDVVDSLSVVVKQLLEQGEYEKVSWFGHSGGGVLAVLLASRFLQTRAVVTVAANLDLDAWSRYIGSNDLSGSLNPALLSPLPRSIRQRHYAGGKDRIVPPALMVTAVKHLGSELLILDHYDHVCCWELIWPSILNDLAEK